MNGWEEGKFVFYPNYMPKKYAILIVPISGFLVCVAAVVSIIDDSLKLKRGEYGLNRELDANIES